MRGGPKVTFSGLGGNAEEDVDEEVFIFLVRIPRMIGCVYRPSQRHTSTSTQRMLEAFSSRCKFKESTVGVSVLSPHPS